MSAALGSVMLPAKATAIPHGDVASAPASTDGATFRTSTVRVAVACSPPASVIVTLTVTSAGPSCAASVAVAPLPATLPALACHE